MVLNIKGSYKMDYHPDGPDGEKIEIDFTPPWRRISMIEEIEKQAGVKLSRKFKEESARKELDDLVTKLNLECPPPRSAARLMTSWPVTSSRIPSSIRPSSPSSLRS